MLQSLLRYLPALLFLPGVLTAQTLERSFGLELAPHANQRRISAGAGVTIRELNRIDSLETGNFGYSTGLVYETRTDRIGLTTGLRYLRAGYETLEQTLPGGNGQAFRDEVVANYLSVPLELNFYQDVTARDRVLFLLGVGGQLHLGTRTVRTSFTNGSETDRQTLEDGAPDYRPLLVSFITGIGYDRKLGADWALRLQPTFQFFLNGNLRPDTDAVANRNYYQVGLRLSVRRLLL